MILVDPRAGSADYIAPLRALGATVEETTLEFGDVAFYGSERVIGIELKKLADLLQCITTGRLTGTQLPGLLRTYNHSWLIIEGIWRPNPIDGVLEIRRGKSWAPASFGRRTWMFRDFAAFLTTLEIKGGIRIRHTSSEDDTARTVYSLYTWWLDSGSHKSHLAFDQTTQIALQTQVQRERGMTFDPTPVSFRRKFAVLLPKIGIEKSAAVAAHFPSALAMATASETDWLEVEGVGKGIAKKIVEAIHATE